MSFGASALVWHHSKAKGTDLLVLMAIANYINDEGAWPKVATIALGARTSERQVHRSLAALKELGELDWDKGAGKGSGVYKTSRYQLLLVCPDECQGDWNHSVRQFVRSRGDNLSGLEVTHTADKPITEPVKEPLLKKPHRIPQDWSASVALLKWATERHPYIDALILSENFKNHWLSAGTSSALKVDWDAAFRTWVGKAAMDLPEWKKQGNPIETRKKIDQDKELTAKLIEEQREKSSTPPPTCQHGQSIIRCRKCLLGIN